MATRYRGRRGRTIHRPQVVTGGRRYADPVGIFGRQSARERLRRATRESLAIPSFSAPVDCTPWVTGGLWPAELSATTAETATLAEHLSADLQRIAWSANDELRSLRRAGLADPARHAAEAKVVSEARARAERRVESALRHMRNAAVETHSTNPRVNAAENRHRAGLDSTQVIPAVTAELPPADPPVAVADEQPDVTEAPEISEAAEIAEIAEIAEDAGDAGDAEAAADELIVAPPSEPVIEPVIEKLQVAAQPESDAERLQRLLAFVARQEPRLNWAVGDRADGATVLVTDLAHGWIPSAIALPDGVRLLEPERRSGKVTALLGETTNSVSYAPGYSLGRAGDVGATESSVRPRELPAVADLGWALGDATHWRDGLPRMVHTLARAAASGTGVAEAEIDVLRVHLDTARHRLIVQYPDVEPTLLLECLLLSATESLAIGDSASANYHFSWFQTLSASADGPFVPQL
jgi:Family of unknown function (DUF5631)/Family of unknown function (DUF5632)